MQPHDHQRVVERHPLRLAIATDKGSGVTRDVSTAGVYFTCNGGFEVGARMTFTIDLAGEGEGSPLHLRCSGRVVRVEGTGGDMGVAVEVSTYSIEP